MAGHYLTVGMQYAPTDELRRAGKLAYATLSCARCGEAIAEHVNEFGDRTKGYGLEYDGGGHVCAVMCDACTRRVVDIYGWDFAGRDAMVEVFGQDADELAGLDGGVLGYGQDSAPCACGQRADVVEVYAQSARYQCAHCGAAFRYGIG